MTVYHAAQRSKPALFIFIFILGAIGFIIPQGAWSRQDPRPETGSAGKASGDAKPSDNSASISFSKDILALFKDQKCLVCHRGENPSGLDLDDNVAYKNLVNAKSQEDKAAVLVKPGDPDASYLYQKLIGPGKDGTIMPPKGKMEDAELNKVVQWIKQGAKDN